MDLEALTNKQLRAKCLEYGLPNVPVTDTSRKILIRKLNAAMNGTTTTTTKKAATSTPTNKSRKTMHATITTTVSSGDDDEDNFIIKTQRTNNTETRRRQTTHVAPVATVTTKATAAAKPRSSAQATNLSYERNIPVTHSTTIGDSFADRNSDRQRRSVSLTKTGVLTTSYSTETVKAPSPVAAAAINEDDYVDLQEEEEDDELEDVEMENVELQQTAAPSQVYTHPTYAGYNQSNAVFNIPQAPPSAPSMAATTNKLYPDLHSTGLQHDYYSGLDGMRASQSSSARLSNLGYSRNAPTSYMPSTMAAHDTATTSSTQRQTIGFNVFNTPPGYQSNLPSTSTTAAAAATKRYTVGGVTKRHTARAIDNDELAASSSDDQYEAPYLTKFSRNLENMKPEPIYKRNSAGGASYSSPSYMGMQRRRGAYEREDGVSLSQLWAKLDQKYHLQTALYFVLFFLFVVFVYVFFLQ